MKRISQMLSGHFHTLRQRLILILGVCMLLCFMLVASVSYFSIQSMEKNGMDATLKSDVIQLNDILDGDYDTLVQLSQQMSVEGSVGKQVNQYLSMKDTYDRIEASYSISSIINDMTFSHSNLSLIGYVYDQHQPNAAGGFGTVQANKTLFFNLPLKNGSNVKNKEPLVKTAVLQLQPIHSSYIYSSDKYAVSLLRNVNFSDNNEYCMYGEIFSSVPSKLESLSKIRGMPYTLLQINSSGKILYSSSPEFKTETLFPAVSGLKDLAVSRENSYICMAKRSTYGYSNVLLVPEAGYSRQGMLLQARLACIFLLAAILVVLTGFLLFHMLYRPLQTLSHDMMEVGKGNITPEKHMFGIDEFDSLFARFESMKIQVTELLEDVRQEERKRQQLEIDKLYYQINPHFLMNALYSVHWMAVLHKQPEIDNFINKLNFILGYSLGKTCSKATFRSELKYVKLYLELQKERYDFETWMDVEESPYLDYPCARFIMQPLVENAIYHSMDEFGNIWISLNHIVVSGRDYIKVIIRDDGQGFPAGANTGSDGKSPGIGLRYVKMSLLSFYKEDAHLYISSEENVGTKVTLLLPVREEETT